MIFIVYFSFLLRWYTSVVIAGKLAQQVDFISFGTNNLTQLVWGISREDYIQIFNKYLWSGLIEYNPFDTIDEDGVITKQNSYNKCEFLDFKNQEFQETLELLAEQGIRNFEVTGGGEPFLNTSLQEIIDKIRNQIPSA